MRQPGSFAKQGKDANGHAHSRSIFNGNGWATTPSFSSRSSDDLSAKASPETLIHPVLGWGGNGSRPVSAAFRGGVASRGNGLGRRASMAKGSRHIQDRAPGAGLTGDLSECLACALLVISKEKKITAVSPEAEKLFNIRRDKLLNNPTQVLPPALQKIIEETLANGKAVQDRRVAIAVPGQDELNISVTTTIPIGYDAAQEQGVIAVLTDLTFAEKLERNLRRLDRLASIGTFSASMAHEIKNALVAVKTFFDLLPKSNQSAELAEIVTREITRIDSIVSQMLKFASPAKPTFSPLHLHEILEHSLRLIEHQLDRKKIKLSLRFAASPDAIKGDDYQLEQAFFNLFFNAIEAMGPNGRLTVSTKIVRVRPGFSQKSGKIQRHLLVTVKDTGVGIPMENLARLFEPFFTTKPNGTGLGLSITRRIIQEHRGWINVQSAAHRGTTFDILFPLLKRSARTREPD